MKISILIGLVLVVASSSAYSWVLVSQAKNGYGGDGTITYTVKCNSGIQQVITSRVVLLNWNYQTSQNLNFTSLDKAAAKACNE